MLYHMFCINNIRHVMYMPNTPKHNVDKIDEFSLYL